MGKDQFRGRQTDPATVQVNYTGSWESGDARTNEVNATNRSLRENIERIPCINSLVAVSLAVCIGTMILLILGVFLYFTGSAIHDLVAGVAEDLDNNIGGRKILSIENMSMVQQVLTNRLFGQLAQVFVLFLAGIQAFNLLPGRGVGGKLDTLYKLFSHPGAMKAEHEERLVLEKR